MEGEFKNEFFREGGVSSFNLSLCLLTSVPMRLGFLIFKNRPAQGMGDGCLEQGYEFSLLNACQGHSGVGAYNPSTEEGESWISESLFGSTCEKPQRKVDGF